MTLDVLISGASALLGAVIGALASLLGGWRQRSWQVESERTKAIREKAELAARKCESLCDQLAKDIILEATTTYKLGDPAAKARLERIDSASPQIHATALYLPEPLRARINEAAEILCKAEDVAQHHHYSRISTIAGTVRGEVYAMIAAFLQENDHPETEPKMAEYRAALKDLYKYDEEYREYNENSHDVDFRHRRERFHKRHPELRPQTTESEN